MPLGEPIRGRLRYGLDNPFTRNVDPTLVLDLPFSEGVGTVARDRSLYGNNGTISGASWVDGKVGKALSFDGVDDYVEVADSSTLDSSFTELTVLFWVNLQSLDTTQAFIDKYYLGATRAYTIYVLESALDNKIRLRINTVDGVVGLDSAAALLLGWSFICMRYDGSEISIYINGIKDLNTAAQTGALPDGDQNLRIGYTLDGSWPLNGVLDEIRIYKRALTLAEIRRLYNEGK